MQTALRITGRPGALVVLALLLLATPSLRAQPVAIIEPDELRRGMRGFGLTTFQGTEIDTFEVEILGVMKGALGPRMDLVLVRLSGGPLEHTGLIRGMSGSPVYIDDRLVGAVSYGWTFSKDPIGAITPISYMLDVARRESPAPQQEYWRPVELDAETTRLLGGRGASALEPLGTPVSIAGFSPAARRVLREALEPLGMQVLDSPAGQALSDQQAPFAPGASLGVQLIRGDRSATGIGTVTWVGDGRFVGFGHPMMLKGATNMPATGAYIHQVIPNQVASFKLGTATQAIGAVQQDRLPGIAGALGAASDMLPVEVALRSPATDARFHFEVLRDRDLSAPLARSVLLTVLQSTEKLFGDATLRLRTHIALKDGRALARQQIYSGRVAIMAAALEALQPFNALLRSPFSGLAVDSLRFDVEVGETLAQARIAALRLSTPNPKAGQQLALQVKLQPYRAEPITERVELNLPSDLEPGPLVLRVGSGAMSEAWEAERRPDAFAPRDAEHLLELLGREGAADELVIELFRPGAGFTIDGRELPALPPSAHAVLAADRSAGRLGPVQGQVVLRQTIRTDYVLLGEQSLEMTLRKP